MRLGETDVRALGLGTLLAGSITFVHVAAGTGGIAANTTRTLVMAIALAAVPAGVAVGLRTRSYDRPLIEGGSAAVCGTVLGVLGWAILRAATVEGLALAYRLDIIFVVVGYNGLVFAAVFPFLFLVGGYTAARVTEWTARPIDDELTIGRFR
ncbi:hypothetical protein [Halorhabdus amylolytica]|uniref:hypothetical protein n=1 Tax=Halorhabdus amylolytica TaxID=2559573 RepID=UPI0010AA8733|nr:hypothetical protein [Halorhabdus amylolytica]